MEQGFELGGHDHIVEEDGQEEGREEAPEGPRHLLLFAAEDDPMPGRQGRRRDRLAGCAGTTWLGFAPRSPAVTRISLCWSSRRISLGPPAISQVTSSRRGSRRPAGNEPVEEASTFVSCSLVQPDPDIVGPCRSPGTASRPARTESTIRSPTAPGVEAGVFRQGVVPDPDDELGLAFADIRVDVGDPGDPLSAERPGPRDLPEPVEIVAADLRPTSAPERARARAASDRSRAIEKATSE